MDNRPVCRARIHFPVKLKHWRAFPGIIGLEAAPVLEFEHRTGSAAD
jgi:hypothetical protein